MKTFNLKKTGILLVMMLVASAILVGPVSAGWHYYTDDDYRVGAYGQASSYQYGYLYKGSGESYTGPEQININLEVLGTDAAPGTVTYSTGSVTTSLTTPLLGYYSTNQDVNLYESPYNPMTRNYCNVGSAGSTVYASP
ncbi:hypothetical protein [Methanogenium organophilum]|uniref:Uncharacterized protein n=1 Tax=Methanogenium organophilum TaxID=2199 RepID=A0A9X9S5Q7_METOG|nr:hypothetical protein [Methanogenium organophilum]WAI01400.1 hypothetical protein OU421_00560 [Methanogenium organophilum]